MKELMRVLFAIFRYPAAIVVAFVASMTTVFYLPDLFPGWTSNVDTPFWEFTWLFSIGLAGVTAGGIFLPRKQQWIGSIFLLFLGLGFAFFIFGMFSENDHSTISDLFPLLPLGIGGLIPVIIHFSLRPRQKSKLLDS